MNRTYPRHLALRCQRLGVVIKTSLKQTLCESCVRYLRSFPIPELSVLAPRPRKNMKFDCQNSGKNPTESDAVLIAHAFLAIPCRAINAIRLSRYLEVTIHNKTTAIHREDKEATFRSKMMFCQDFTKTHCVKLQMMDLYVRLSRGNLLKSATAHEHQNHPESFNTKTVPPIACKLCVQK